LLRAAGLIPVGISVAALTPRVGDAIRAATAALRPSATGTSSTRCALCGAGNHAMLDPGCPAARNVL
jgi:hypothetical protein